MALSENTPVKQYAGPISRHPVYTGVHIYDGAALGNYGGSGYAGPLVAGSKFIGHAVEEADNTSGASGAIHVKHLIGKYRLEVTLASIAVTDLGKRVYMSADGTYTLTSTSNTFVGRVTRYVTTNTCEVEFDTTAVEFAVGELAYANIVDSAAIGASSTASADFDKTVALPVAKLQVGDLFRFKVAVVHTGSNTGHTLTATVVFGTEVILTSGALTIGAQNDVIHLQGEFVIRAIGSGGSLACSGKVFSILNATKALSAIVAGGTVSESMAAAITMKVTGQYGTSDANNTAVLKHFSVERIPAATE